MTAAHCLWEKGSSAPRREDYSTYYLGKYELYDHTDNNVEISRVHKFIVHPDWTPGNNRYESDIGISVLEKTITFTTVIRPICIYSGSPGHNDIIGEKGFISGK